MSLPSSPPREASTTRAAAVRVSALGKRYSQDDPPALRDVTFEVAEGELLAVVGPSGCGKTTLLRLLCGLTPPSEGVVCFDGRPVLQPLREAGLVFQDYTRSLFPWLRVQQNVLFPLRRAALPKRERIARAEAVLEETGLGGLGGKFPWQLSSGMQQRVAIARALVSRPRLLLLDEPFASVDALTRAELQDVLLRLHSEAGVSPVTIVHVTHDVDEAVYLADRVIVLGHGPGRVVGDVEVELGRPRAQSATRSSPRFLAIRNEIHEIIAAGGRRA